MLIKIHTFLFYLRLRISKHTHTHAHTREHTRDLWKPPPQSPARSKHSLVSIQKQAIKTYKRCRSYREGAVLMS